MKKRNLKYLFVCFSIICSCTSQKEKPQIIWEKYDNGNYKVVHQFLNDTNIYSQDYYYLKYYENGNVMLKGLEKNRVKKGEWSFFRSNGILRAKISYKAGILDGPVILYDNKEEVISKDIIESGELKNNNEEVRKFLNQYNMDFGMEVNWQDSLNLMIKHVEDSIIPKLKE